MVTRKMGTHIDIQTHVNDTLDNHVTLTFNLLTSGSMHIKGLPRATYVLTFGVNCSCCLAFTVQTERQTENMQTMLQISKPVQHTPTSSKDIVHGRPLFYWLHTTEY